MNTDYYNYYSEPTIGELVAIFSGILLFTIPIIILSVIGLWKLFKKAGQPGWKSIIPFYNYWTMIKITFGRARPLYFFGVLIPLIGLVFPIVTTFKFAKRFGASDAMAVLSFFVAPIAYLVMGFSHNYQYQGADHNDNQQVLDFD